MSGVPGGAHHGGVRGRTGALPLRTRTLRQVHHWSGHNTHTANKQTDQDAFLCVCLCLCLCVVE